MSRALPKYNKRRVTLIGGAAAVALSGTVIAGFALAGETAGSSANNGTSARTLASPGTITCPDVRSKLPAVPASAKAEVDRNLALLNTQIQEANKRLVDTVGQGGPNFVQNAILGPLEDKRVATVNRIATAIGRTAAKPQGLDALAPCALNAAGTNAGGAQNSGKATPGGTANQQAGGNKGNTGNAGGSTAAGAISCPDVKSKLPAIPASAKAEVDRNLTLLNTQIQEANKRLQSTVGQGGPNFVQNAILGPLADKRKSTIDRIAISIGRTAQKPQGLDSLAACTLNK
jgi:F0F1-type ATP synthase membrane subunit b/b'